MAKKKRNKYINREMSWLSFNERVLQEAADSRVPLLMRIRFLAIFSSNQDEFFRVRVASLRRIVDFYKKAKVSLDFNPRKILKQIHSTVVHQQERFESIFQEIKGELANHNIFIVNEAELTPKQGKKVREYFHQKVRPYIVPLMISEMEDFPQLRDGYIYLGVVMSKKGNPSDRKYALLEMPSDRLSRFFVFERSENRTYVILLDNVIRYCLNDLFYVRGYDQCMAYTVKVTKDAEMDFDNDVSKSFLELVEIAVKRRRLGNPVRFIYDQNIDVGLLNFIVQKLKLSEEDNIIAGGRYHNFKDFMNFPMLGPSPLYPEKHKTVKHYIIDPVKSLFSLLKKQDVMIHLPYHSFNPLIDLLREAAIDPQVTTIKATLYRLAKHSNIINALVNARKNGKEVVVVIELQARFDESANIKWAGILQDAGIRVIHGQPGIKIHSKLLLVERKEGTQTVRYASVGTGNFNESTAKLYCDDHLLTTHKGITKDISKVFEQIETNMLKTYKHLLVSPHTMQLGLIKQIDKEIENAQNGKKAFIIAKMNSLNEEEMINKFYEASQAGVIIWLIIRGICSLVPGIKGVSDNIQAISIVDKFLEHSRIYYFANNGKEKCYIASADLLERNLHRRIEVACPIYDKKIRHDLKMILLMQLKDNTKARWLNHPNGNIYKNDDRSPIRAQDAIYDYFKAKEYKDSI